MSKNLHEFFNNPANMHAREAILMHKFSLDIKVAAARKNYYLNSYFDDVDHDGFDVIFDDQDYIKKIQVKSVGVDSPTKAWSIHKKILRPLLGLADTLGFEGTPEGVGTEGGVVLIEYKDNGDVLTVDYYYTDLFVLLAFQHDLIRRTHASSKKAVDDCLSDWHGGLGTEQLRVPKAAFLKAKNAEALLSLMGLHGPRASGWKYAVIQLVNNIQGDPKPDLLCHEDKLKKFVWDEIQELVNESKLAGA